MQRDGVIATYIMASGRNGTLYIGVTGNLWKRVREHKQGVHEGFSKTYGCKRLVWFQTFERMTGAIAREKTMKGWPRAWKLKVIEEMNPEWRDLQDERWGVDWRAALLDPKDKPWDDDEGMTMRGWRAG